MSAKSIKFIAACDSTAAEPSLIIKDLYKLIEGRYGKITRTTTETAPPKRITLLYVGDTCRGRLTEYIGINTL